MDIPEEDRVVKRQAQPILITDASRSQDDQLHSRQVRYVVLMSIRLACLIVGAVLVSAQAPLLWLWLSLCGVGMVLLPWLAVMLANDRPPKEQHRLATRLQHRHHDQTPPRSLPVAESPHQVIDGEF